MKRVLITGMSGTGKSTVIRELAKRGFKAVDSDYGGFSEMVDLPVDEVTGVGSGRDWIWREGRIQELLSAEDADVLFLSGCAPNQGKFYSQFDHIVLLTAPEKLNVERLVSRTNNPYGKRPEEIEGTLENLRVIEPRLREIAGHVVSSDAPLEEVVAKVLEAVGEA